MNTQVQLDVVANAALVVHAQELEERIAAVLCGRDVPWPPTDLERAVLSILAGHKGHADAIRIAEIQLQLGPHGLEGCVVPEREIKATVKSLVENFRLPIGGSRRPPCGYFLVLTVEDRELAIHPLVAELRSISRRVRSLSNKHELARLFGQIQLDLDRERGAA